MQISRFAPFAACLHKEVENTMTNSQTGMGDASPIKEKNNKYRDTSPLTVCLLNQVGLTGKPRFSDQFSAVITDP